MTDLANQHCVPCEGGVPALTAEKIKTMMKQIPGWEVNPENTELKRSFEFKNFTRTMAFVNAVMYVAVIENHHPDVEFGYNYCHIRYSTHAINGLSENDFICAAKVNALLFK